MIYVWETPSKFYESVIGDDLSRYTGIYDRENGPSCYQFNGYNEGKTFSFAKKDLIFTFNTKKSELLSYDVLSNDGLFIIVNERIKNVLDTFAKDDLQFLQPKICCTDGELDSYYVVNVLFGVAGINKEKSKCEFCVVNSKTISGFEYGSGTLVYNHDCLGVHHIAREKEFEQLVLISQELKDALCALTPPIKEVSFVLPEDMVW